MWAQMRFRGEMIEVEVRGNEVTEVELDGAPIKNSLTENQLEEIYEKYLNIVDSEKEPAFCNETFLLRKWGYE